MITVLYVDADPKMYLTLSYIFEKYESVSVFPVASGEDALTWLDRYHADVIVSEYELPGMNGIALLHAVRSQGISLPFIFFSVSDSAQVKNEAYQGDVFGFIPRKGSERRAIMNLLRLIMWAAGYNETEYSLRYDLREEDTDRPGTMQR
ncbi:MAG: response regulator [Methanoregula sp.]|nr:response regulator [Methanoregula sp.]